MTEQIKPVLRRLSDLRHEFMSDDDSVREIQSVEDSMRKKMESDQASQDGRLESIRERFHDAQSDFGLSDNVPPRQMTEIPRGYFDDLV